MMLETGHYVGQEVKNRILKLIDIRPCEAERFASGEILLAQAEINAGIDPTRNCMWMSRFPVESARRIVRKHGNEYAFELAQKLMELVMMKEPRKE